MSKDGVFSGPYFPAFRPNTGKYGPETTPYLDTFHVVPTMLKNQANDYEHLLKQSKSPSMEIRQLRIIPIEVFKTLNGLNPKFMADIFHHSPYSTLKKYNLYAHDRNTSKYGEKSLRVLGAHIWNSLSDSVKNKSLMNMSKVFIKTWLGAKYKRCLCAK